MKSYKHHLGGGGDSDRSLLVPRLELLLQLGGHLSHQTGAGLVGVVCTFFYFFFEMSRVKINFCQCRCRFRSFSLLYIDHLMMRSRVRRWLSFCIFVRVHLDRCRLQVKHALVKTTHQDQVNSDSRPPQDLCQKKLPTWLLAFVLAPPPVLELTSEPTPPLS